jgi:hypothetical protein
VAKSFGEHYSSKSLEGSERIRPIWPPLSEWHCSSICLSICRSLRSVHRRYVGKCEDGTKTRSWARISSCRNRDHVIPACVKSGNCVTRRVKDFPACVGG